MKEDFLHYLWKFKKFDFIGATTTQGQELQVLKPGMHNHLAGPDFFNAQVRIDGQLWAGNVEVHLKSSDWYAHHHERDTAYENVILHVVWEHDVDVYDRTNRALPTLELRHFVKKDILSNYFRLFSRSQKKFINCERDITEVPIPVMDTWMERLFFERLERKVGEIDLLLQESANDWEAVLFKMLARNFGTKINAGSFMEMARLIPFSTIRKCRGNNGQLEAMFLGACDLLPPETQDVHVQGLKNAYEFLKVKFGVSQKISQPVQFFKLRPQNFPTIRLSQLAKLYEQEDSLFSRLISAKAKKEIYDVLQVESSAFWTTHYTFEKVHKPLKKMLSPGFMDLIIINTIMPLTFAYWQRQDTYKEDVLLGLINSLPREKNSVVNGFVDLRFLKKSALVSQALLRLKNEYCDKNRCLHCAVGNYLITDAQGGSPKL